MRIKNIEIGQSGPGNVARTLSWEVYGECSIDWDAEFREDGLVKRHEGGHVPEYGYYGYEIPGLTMTKAKKIRKRLQLLRNRR